jgi:hypothetical protein
MKARGKVQTAQGETIAEFDVPETLYEVPLNRYIDFLIEVGNSTPDNYLAQHAKAVSAFYGVDLSDVFNGVYETEKDKEDFELNTVAQLHGYAAKLIDNHLRMIAATPKVSTGAPYFDFCGEYYNIPVIATKVLASGLSEVLPNLTVIESIEALEANRAFEMLIDDDETGSQAFAKYLRLLAILCRKDGEVLPTDDVERENFILERANHFGGVDGEVISAGAAIDTDFFLTAFSGRLKSSRNVATFLYLQSLTIAALVTLKQRPKRGQPLRITAKKSLNGSDGGRLSRRLLIRDSLKRARKRK